MAAPLSGALLAVTGITSELSISNYNHDNDAKERTARMVDGHEVELWTMPAGSLKLTVRVHSRSSQANYLGSFDSSNGADVKDNVVCRFPAPVFQRLIGKIHAG